MSDLIDRKAILKHIEKIRQGLQMMDDTHRASIVMNGMHLCEEAVRNQPSVQPESHREWYMKGYRDAQRWIPVTEKLPEENADILVTFCDKEETWILPVNYAMGTWYDCIFDTALNPINVVAWMPLPEPYKGGENENR